MAHLVMIFPCRLAGGEQVRGEVVGKAAERGQDDELGRDDDQRDDPDDHDHHTGATCLRLEVKRVTDGLVTPLACACREGSANGRGVWRLAASVTASLM